VIRNAECGSGVEKRDFHSKSGNSRLLFGSEDRLMLHIVRE